MNGQPQRYLLSLGSNVRHPRHGSPPSVLRAAAAELGRRGLTVRALSRIVASEPLGPSRRRFANASVVVEIDTSPIEVLRAVKRIERDFGRKRGRRWAARVLDIDLVLWSGGRWLSRELSIPHPAFRHRRFVVLPSATIALHWRDPATGLSLAHLAARLTRPRPAPRARSRSGP